MGGGGLINAALALALVIALIYALAWLLRRLPANRLRGADGIRIISSIALGGKERAVLVEINHQQLLLGVAPGAVSLLHGISPGHRTPEETPVSAAGANAEKNPSFFEKMSEIKKTYFSEKMNHAGKSSEGQG